MRRDKIIIQYGSGMVTFFLFIKFKLHCIGAFGVLILDIGHNKCRRCSFIKYVAICILTESDLDLDIDTQSPFSNEFQN